MAHKLAELIRVNSTETRSNEPMDITYYIKDVYGAELWYPVSSDARMVCDLMGTVTLTEHAVTVLKDNNITPTQVFKPKS